MAFWHMVKKANGSNKYHWSTGELQCNCTPIQSHSHSPLFLDLFQLQSKCIHNLTFHPASPIDKNAKVVFLTWRTPFWQKWFVSHCNTYCLSQLDEYDPSRDSPDSTNTKQAKWSLQDEADGQKLLRWFQRQSDIRNDDDNDVRATATGDEERVLTTRSPLISIPYVVRVCMRSVKFRDLDLRPRYLITASLVIYSCALCRWRLNKIKWILSWWTCLLKFHYTKTSTRE